MRIIVQVKFLLLTMLIFFSSWQKILSGDFKHKCHPKLSKSGWCYNYSCERKTYQNDSINNYKRYCLGERINSPTIQVKKEISQSHKTINLEILKEACESIGFTPKTESFGNCVLKLSERDDLVLKKLDTMSPNKLELTKFSSYVCSLEHDNTKLVKSVRLRNLRGDYISLKRTSEKGSQEFNLISRADSFCEKRGAEKMDSAYYANDSFNFTCEKKIITRELCITKYYLPREFTLYSHLEKNDLSASELELTVAPKRIKRYSSLQTVKNNAPPKPSYNLLEDLLSAGLIIGGAYLLGNALSSPSNAVAPSTTIINKIKPNNNLIYGPYDTPFGY